MIDSGQIIIAQKQLECKNDIYVMMMSWGHYVTSKDRYIIIVSTVAETAVIYLGFEYRSVHDGDLNKTLKHITGYSDADWAGDPVTRKSTSCTLCHVDQFLLTSECRGQETVALSSGESEMYALGALSAELIFAQAVLKEVGLSFLIHARADSSTARAVAAKQAASRKMKHVHTRFSCSFKIWYFENC